MYHVNKHESLGGLFHHLVEERTNTKKGIIKKHAMLQHCKEQILVKIKGYVKPIEHQLEAHMGYDGKNEDAVNPNGKYQ
jgi:hypothetical protein